MKNDPEYKRQWYQKNKQRIAVQNKENYLKRKSDPEKLEKMRAQARAAAIRYARAHRDKVYAYAREYMKRWRKTPASKAIQKRWCSSARGKASARKYHVSPKGKISRRNNYIRWYYDLGSEQAISLVDWMSILESYNHRCAYCLREFGAQLRPSMDHFIPLSKGGLHAASNVVPACRSCNSSKHNRIFLGGPHAVTTKKIESNKNGGDK